MSKGSTIVLGPARLPFPGRYLFAMTCMAVLALSLVLNPEKPTGGVELCPMMKYTHLPCPGCGITRSLISCSRGDFAEAFHLHPLGPATWLVAIGGASILLWPRRWWDALTAFVASHRRGRDRLILAGIVVLTLFGILRIVFIYTYTTPPAWWPW